MHTVYFKRENALLVGMFLAFPTKLDCRRPAFWLERAVTKPTVRAAGLEPADHLVGATIRVMG